MQTGSKIIKTQKSKFKKDVEKETFKQFRNKHQDKSAYRMLKQEEKENVSELYSK